MERSEIAKMIIDMTADKMSWNTSDVEESSRFVEDLGADSLDAVDLCMDIECEFNIEITNDEMERMVTVKDVVDYVCEAEES